SDDAEEECGPSSHHSLLGSDLYFPIRAGSDLSFSNAGEEKPLKTTIWSTVASAASKTLSGRQGAGRLKMRICRAQPVKNRSDPHRTGKNRSDPQRSDRAISPRPPNSMPSIISVLNRLV